MRYTQILSVIALGLLLAQCANETQDKTQAPQNTHQAANAENESASEAIRASLTEFEDGSVKEEFLVTAPERSRVFVESGDGILLSEGYVEQAGKPIMIVVYSRRGEKIKWSSELSPKVVEVIVGAQAPNGQLVNL